MPDIIIKLFLCFGIFSVTLSILMVVFYWWDDKKWRKERQQLRQQYDDWLH